MIPLKAGEKRRSKRRLSVLQKEWSVFRMLLTSRKPLDLVFGFMGIVGKFDMSTQERKGRDVETAYVGNASESFGCKGSRKTGKCEEGAGRGSKQKYILE